MVNNEFFIAIPLEGASTLSDWFNSGIVPKYARDVYCLYGYSCVDYPDETFSYIILPININPDAY